MISVRKAGKEGDGGVGADLRFVWASCVVCTAFAVSACLSCYTCGRVECGCSLRVEGGFIGGFHFVFDSIHIQHGHMCRRCYWNLSPGMHAGLPRVTKCAIRSTPPPDPPLPIAPT